MKHSIHKSTTMQMYINYCCIPMKQTEGLGNGGNALPHHTHGHAPSLSPSHTCNKFAWNEVQVSST